MKVYTHTPFRIGAHFAPWQRLCPPKIFDDNWILLLEKIDFVFFFINWSEHNFIWNNVTRYFFRWLRFKITFGSLSLFLRGTRINDRKMKKKIKNDIIKLDTDLTLKIKPFIYYACPRSFYLKSFMLELYESEEVNVSQPYKNNSVM